MLSGWLLRREASCKSYATGPVVKNPSVKALTTEMSLNEADDSSNICVKLEVLEEVDFPASSQWHGVDEEHSAETSIVYQEALQVKQEPGVSYQHVDEEQGRLENFSCGDDNRTGNFFDNDDGVKEEEQEEEEEEGDDSEDGWLDDEESEDEMVTSDEQKEGNDSASESDKASSQPTNREPNSTANRISNMKNSEGESARYGQPEKVKKKRGEGRKPRKRHVCHICGQEFVRSQGLHIHLWAHKGEKPYQCSICDARYTQKHRLKLHIMIVHSEVATSDEHKKDNDSESDKASSQSTNHEEKSATFGQPEKMEKKLGKGIKPCKRHVCNICGQEFARSQGLYIHVRAHKGEKPYQCSICGARYTQKHRLKLHITRVHSETKPTHQCSQCGKTFYEIAMVKRHEKTHLAEKPNVCNECGKRFWHKYELTRHFKVIHLGELDGRVNGTKMKHQYPCSLCDKRYSYERHLRRHELSHTGERPFQCVVCNLRFFQKAHLQGHMRTHTGEKPHQCTWCKKRFADKSSLTKHVKSHLRKDGLECTQCDMRFLTKRSLSRHQADHPWGKAVPVCTVPRETLSGS